MDRTRRLAEAWSWLPAFRAAAETEHLPTAGARLHVSPAALSRSIRLLEDALGVALFDRANRRITLNEQGASLLRHLRAGMRLIDDGLDAAISTEIRGPLFISAPGPFASLFVVPAVAELAQQYPALEPHISAASVTGALAALKAGQLDIALLDDPVSDPELSVERLLTLDYGVYCAPGHPLHRLRRWSHDALLEHRFAAPPEGADDHWPGELARVVRIRTSSMQLGIDLCCRGACLAVLPSVVAQAAPVKLRRLPVAGFAPAALFLVYRPSTGASDRTALALRALRRAAAAAGPPARPGPRRARRARSR